MSPGAEWIRRSGLLRGRRILCLIDGEHYPAVTIWAVRELRKLGSTVCGYIFLGGSEKISTPAVRDSFAGIDRMYLLRDTASPWNEIFRIVQETDADMAVELSDDPVVGFEERIRLASAFLAAGVSYLGADFYFAVSEQEGHPAAASLRMPGLRIWGTNKRVGKTAFSIYTADLLRKIGKKPAILTMGRGGPDKPELILPDSLSLSPDFLISKSAEGVHAASDCWEDAVLARVPTVGCKRCGGGMAGPPFFSNVREGVELLNQLDCNFAIIEGSGPTSPPVHTDASLLIVSARIPPDRSVAFFGEYRIRTANLVAVSMCEDKVVRDRHAQEIFRHVKSVARDIPVVFTVFRIEPAEEIRGRRIFLAITASDRSAAENRIACLENEYGGTVTASSIHLANRTELLKEMNSTVAEWDLLLTELKASAVDVAAQFAKEHQKDIVFLHNRPVLLGGDFERLDEALLSIIPHGGAR